MAGEQDILARLEALNISFDKVQHGPVMTCDAQAAALGPVEGIILKNLLLKVYGLCFRIWASMAMQVVVARQTGPCTGCPWGAVLGSYPQHVSPSRQFGLSSWQPPP
ncbi:hypothetical protein ACKKBG_A23880 [Auxenochlorella protothecoides x Auxenochlorella symbiontica]